MNIPEIVTGFCGAMVWADCREGSNPRVTLATRLSVSARVRSFIESNQADSEQALGKVTPDKFGFMLFLSMAGHGTGFFDEDALPETLRDSLQDACHAYRIETEQYGGWIGIYSDRFALNRA